MADRIPFIILADDDSDDRLLFKEALRELKADVHFVGAEHGIALMDMLSEGTLLPDMIFLDINMPLKNGKECLAEIKNNNLLSEIAVIMYSTSADPRDIEETYKGGANLYLKKPDSFDVLIETISQLLMLDWSSYKPQPSKEEFVWHGNLTTY